MKCCECGRDANYVEAGYSKCYLCLSPLFQVRITQAMESRNKNDKR